MAEFIRFTERLVSSEFRYAFALSAADLTGSRSLDLVATDADRGLYWFENDGAGNFTRHVVHLRTNELLERHAVADVNGDGKPEIVCVDNLNGCLLSFGFDGDPRDPHSWRHSYITEGGIPGAYDVAIADLDGDGNLDVAGSGWRISNQFAWFENRDGVWVKHIIDDDAPESRAVCAADVNGNGLIDIVGTASKRGEVAWYQNPGNSLDSPWTKHVIDTAPRPIHGHPVDMDGDGDIDLVMALGFDLPKGADPTGTQQIVWYENDGSSGIGPWPNHVISEHFPEAFEAIAADLDGDGQVEVVATAWGDGGRVALFKHRGDPRGSWDMQILKDNWARANMVIVADLDGDGRLDVAACAERGSNELRWWRNEGPATG